MSKTAWVIIIIVVLLLIIIGFMMYSSAKAKAASAQQNYRPPSTSSQGVNVAAIGNFVGGLITGLKTNEDAKAASNQYTEAELEYMRTGGKSGSV